jgi:hypothetical protein
MDCRLMASIIFSLGVFGCALPAETNVSVQPNNFKIEVPYQSNLQGMFIDTYWGHQTIKYTLLWDNHSPTWANDSVINNNTSITKLDGCSYNTTTAEGTPIKGDVYVCDRIFLGGVEFKEVPFYNISDKIDGVLGANIISNGVWKIDFSKQMLTFASSSDSIGGLQLMERLPAKFTSNGILVEVSFRNHIVKDIQLDLGFNGGILLPPKTFRQVAKGNSMFYKDSLRFSTPSHATITETTHALDTFEINRNRLSTFISSNEQVRESLIGLGFFSQFKYVVIDYINKTVYIQRR